MLETLYFKGPIFCKLTLPKFSNNNMSLQPVNEPPPEMTNVHPLFPSLTSFTFQKVTKGTDISARLVTTALQPGFRSTICDCLEATLFLSCSKHVYKLQQSIGFGKKLKPNVCAWGCKQRERHSVFWRIYTVFFYIINQGYSTGEKIRIWKMGITWDL